MVETRIPAVVVSDDVVVERHVPSSPDAAVAMLALAVYGTVQGLGDDAPLYGCIADGIERSVFVRSPAHGTVVDDEILHMACPESIILVFRCRAHTETHISDYHLISPYIHPMVPESDAFPRSRLA